jgi:hypothetical protein
LRNDAVIAPEIDGIVPAEGKSRDFKRSIAGTPKTIVEK